MLFLMHQLHNLKINVESNFAYIIVQGLNLLLFKQRI